MIYKLTKKQEQQLIEYRDYCYQRGTCSDPVDKEKAEKSVSQIYNEINKKPPRFWYVDSIFMAQIVLNVLKPNLRDNLWANLEDNLRANLEDNLRDNLLDNLGANLRDNLRANLGANLRDNELEYINTNLWGQQDYYWIAFYKYPEMCLGIKYGNDSAKLQAWEMVSESCHWWWAFENIAIISARPELKINNGRLHCDGGPAVLYPDGYAQWYLNGRAVPKWLAETPTKDLDIKKIIEIENVEVRAQGIKKLGIDKFISLGKRPKKSNGYTLLDFSELLGTEQPAPYLLMTNPSTHEKHLEGVHPDCKTVEQAINWRAFGDVNIKWEPVKLT